MQLRSAETGVWLLALLAALGGVVVALTNQPQQSAPALEWLQPPRALAEFELGSADLRLHSDDLRERWTLVALGFTHCPDVCPTTLAQLHALQREVEPAALQVLFVAVDPTRDKPVLLEYVSTYDGGVRAATGTPNQLAQLATALGMGFRVTGSGADTVVSHSTAVALIGPDVQLRGLLRPGFDVSAVTAELLTAMAAVP